MRMDDAEIQNVYPDLIDPPDDPTLLHMARLLDSEYRSPALPASLQRWVPAVPSTWYQQSAGSDAPRRSRRLVPRVASVAALAIACVIALTVTQSLATLNPANLGPPTDAAPPFLPLGLFQHVGAPLYQGGKVELLFISSQPDATAAAERWPIVKALGQFGTFSGLRPALSDLTRMCPAVPTYDFTHAVYRSRYVTLIHKDLQSYDPKGQARQPVQLQRLNRGELALLRRYGGVGLPAPGASGSPAATPSNLAYRLRNMSPPMELLSGYVLNGAYTAYGELVPNPDTCIGVHVQPAPETLFGPVQRALLAGYRKHYVPYVFDIDAETNVITALVCHADKRRPASVCNRHVIISLMKHMK